MQYTFLYTGNIKLWMYLNQSAIDNFIFLSQQAPYKSTSRGFVNVFDYILTFDLDTLSTKRGYRKCYSIWPD